MLYCRRMTLEAEKSLTPSGEAPAPAAAEPIQEKETWKQKVILAVVGGVVGAALGAGGALGVAALTGEYLLRNADKTGEYVLRASEGEFIRDQRTAAYGAYIRDLVAFENKYREAAVYLVGREVAVESRPVSERVLTLQTELQEALEAVRQSKSVVDVVGATEVVVAGQKAIDIYGERKGQVEVLLEEHKLGAQLSPVDQRFAEGMSQMQKEGREPFSVKARESLSIPDQ